MSNRLILAQDGWGETIPDWIEALIRECDQTSQNIVAKQLDLSAAVVSQSIRNRYAGNLSNIESVVRDTFINAPVNCDALGGEIESPICLTWRRRSEKLTSSSPMRVRMFHACRKCPLNSSQTEGDDNDA
ncbi:hypothetical protein [Parasedimentitalea huanghaiensis]|uniref:Transcriptional regulator n=1 Tax=Parasedimentitalea huanghaiensis TaxID=2682100 RepID=A0A6L6WHA4_9RHOB|nr:hypothetical protein [Zongyanglinia huanghaiensis]MVO16830.1 hypothetical protein [Zongyanglinia huanghaiensis]